MAIVIVLARAPADAPRIVVPARAPIPAAVEARAPVVLDTPPVAVREPEQAITPPRTEPEAVLTRAASEPTKDSVNLGRVRLVSTPEERAELETKLERFLQNQADARAAKNPR